LFRRRIRFTKYFSLNK